MIIDNLNRYIDRLHTFAKNTEHIIMSDERDELLDIIEDLERLVDNDNR